MQEFRVPISEIQSLEFNLAFAYKFKVYFRPFLFANPSVA
jgi:hypothetical protein